MTEEKEETAIDDGKYPDEEEMPSGEEATKAEEPKEE